LFDRESEIIIIGQQQQERERERSGMSKKNGIKIPPGDKIHKRKEEKNPSFSFRFKLLMVPGFSFEGCFRNKKIPFRKTSVDKFKSLLLIF